MTYSNSKTWLRTLADQPDDKFKTERDLLRTAYVSIRDRARHLTAEISRDLPEFTVHDIDHLDALWDYCDLIAGDRVQLNPAEAFVLGCSFLIHDAGMSVAAFPGRMAEIKAHALWTDTIKALETEITGKTKDVASLEKQATATVLRLFHAMQAEKIATNPFYDRNGHSTYLIDNENVRMSFGESIGRIARSHWDDLEQVYHDLNKQLGAPTFLPPEWSCDLLKIACLLRTCDICHIDSRRAPYFLKTLRNVSGESALHWNFQEKLARPIARGDRLFYSSMQAFTKNEINEW